jgi:hypothetical protein
MGLLPGQTNNPNGRPPGARNRRTTELWHKLEGRGDKDPADFLSQLVTSESESKELRAAAANMLLPYKYGKCSAVTLPRFIEEPLALPSPTTIAQARENITYISDLKAQGRLDLDTADSLIADNKAAAGILIEEAKLAAQGQSEGQQQILITGGLPPLPGTNINMGKEPTLDSSRIHNGHTIEHMPNTSDNGPAVSTSLAQEPAESANPLVNQGNES